MKSRVRTRVVSVNKQRFTIWDNYERHVDELKAIGATDEDLAPLKEAAEAVAAEEEKHDMAAGRNPALADGGLDELQAPHVCANGWEIDPPSLPAKRWASAAMLKVTGGVPPEDPVGTCYAVLAGLWALKTWSDGRQDRVMQAVTAPGVLASLLPELADDLDADAVDVLSEDYMTLMGFSKKKRAAMEIYNQTLSSIREQCFGRSTAESSSSS